MDIQMYTDMNDPNFVTMDLSSLIHAYEYAVREKNEMVATSLMKMFREGTEEVRLEKTNPVYLFLKEGSKVKEDEITWNMIEEAFLIARLQNNTPILRSLGTVLGHWEQYAVDQKELEGLVKEIIQLPESVRKFILKYHDSKSYQETKRNQVNEIKVSKETEEKINRSVVEIGREKIYKRAA